MIFCVLLLLNNGQLFNAWNPPDVDFLWLLLPLQSESENVSKRQKLSPFLTYPSPARGNSNTRHESLVFFKYPRNFFK